jgi:hypothetical protein
MVGRKRGLSSCFPSIATPGKGLVLGGIGHAGDGRQTQAKPLADNQGIPSAHLLHVCLFPLPPDGLASGYH